MYLQSRWNMNKLRISSQCGNIPLLVDQDTTSGSGQSLVHYTFNANLLHRTRDALGFKKQKFFSQAEWWERSVGDETQLRSTPVFNVYRKSACKYDILEFPTETRTVLVGAVCVCVCVCRRRQKEEKAKCNILINYHLTRVESVSGQSLFQILDDLQMCFVENLFCQPSPNPNKSKRRLTQTLWQ